MILGVVFLSNFQTYTWDIEELLCAKGGEGVVYVPTLVMRKRESGDASRVTIALDSCVNPCWAYGARL